MENEIYGFKAFDKGLINRYGQKFMVGKTYSVSKLIKWGNKGHGFHFCTHLEDCLRYVNAKEEIDIAYIRGFGHIEKHDDDYYGYYDMYVAEKMEILGVLSRNEILDIMLSRPKQAQIRFMRDFKLTEEERTLFIDEEYEKEIKCFRY